MQKIIIVLAALAMPLAGCNTTHPGSIDTIGAAANISQIQADVVAACGVEPTLASIAALITSFNATAKAVDSVVTSVVDSVCKSMASSYKGVSAPLAGHVPPPIKIEGVTVRFEPVRR